jgi:hypothetical protein
MLINAPQVQVPNAPTDAKDVVRKEDLNALKSSVQAVTIESTAWTDNQTTIAVTGATATSRIDVSLQVGVEVTEVNAWLNAKLYAKAQAAGSITLGIIGTVPTVPIHINIENRGEPFVN